MTSIDEKTVIEHDKPQEQRTYEQIKLLNEYLLLHYGEKLSGSFQHNPQPNVTASNIATHNCYSLDINSTAANVFNWGDFGFFNTETGEMEAPRFPTYALNFPYRVAAMALYWYKKLHPENTDGANTTAFDIGTAVGRTAFELTPYFNSVLGLDFSHQFVNAAQVLSTGKTLNFAVPVEGNISFQSTATLSGDVIPSRTKFIQGDACALDTSVQYDCITAANLIDRVPSPTSFLNTLHQITKPGGIVVLTSPYTWLAEYTPVHEWLVSENTTQSTYEALLSLLGPHFNLIHQSHMPFFIRETGRKSQFTLAHCTVWQRK